MERGRASFISGREECFTFERHLAHSRTYLRCVFHHIFHMSNRGRGGFPRPQPAQLQCASALAPGASRTWQLGRQLRNDWLLPVFGRGSYVVVSLKQLDDVIITYDVISHRHQPDPLHHAFCNRGLGAATRPAYSPYAGALASALAGNMQCLLVVQDGSCEAIHGHGCETNYVIC